jgi:nitroreductase
MQPDAYRAESVAATRSFFDLCAARYSLRRFADRPVARELITRCLEAARLAPSASNAQPCRYVVFDDPVRREELARVAFRGVYSASARFSAVPVIVALLIKPTSTLGQLGNALLRTHLQLIDAGIAGEHFVLQAQELGLGTCWIGWFDHRAVRRFLGSRARGLVPVGLIAVGYPPTEALPPARKRRDLAAISGWNDLP